MFTQSAGKEYKRFYEAGVKVVGYLTQSRTLDVFKTDQSTWTVHLNKFKAIIQMCNGLFAKIHFLRLSLVVMLSQNTFNLPRQGSTAFLSVFLSFWYFCFSKELISVQGEVSTGLPRLWSFIWYTHLHRHTVAEDVLQIFTKEKSWLYLLVFNIGIKKHAELDTIKLQTCECFFTSGIFKYCLISSGQWILYLHGFF